MESTQRCSHNAKINKFLPSWKSSKNFVVVKKKFPGIERGMYSYFPLYMSSSRSKFVVDLLDFVSWVHNILTSKMTYIMEKKSTYYAQILEICYIFWLKLKIFIFGQSESHCCYAVVLEKACSTSNTMDQLVHQNLFFKLILFFCHDFVLILFRLRYGKLQPFWPSNF